MLADLVETDGCDASTLGTIWRPAELAGTDSSLQVGRNAVRCLRKNALVWFRWRVQKTFDHASRHIQLGINLAQLKQVVDDLITGDSRQNLVARLADLRCE